MEGSNKIVIGQIIPHILHIKWEIDKNSKVDFVERFGDWVWCKSRPILKINMNDFNIIGEQSSFYLDLEENDRESVIFLPTHTKTYSVQYGRSLGKYIFIPLITSKNVDLVEMNEDSVIKLPLKLATK